MADITMCINGDKCEYRNNCYRYQAKPDYQIQSYAYFYNEEKKCDMYWEMDKEDIRYWQ